MKSCSQAAKTNTEAIKSTTDTNANAEKASMVNNGDSGDKKPVEEEPDPINDVTELHGWVHLTGDSKEDKSQSEEVEDNGWVSVFVGDEQASKKQDDEGESTVV